MRRMNLKTSVILLAIAIFFAGLANQVQAHPPCGAGYHGGYGAGHVPGMAPATGFTPGEGYWYPTQPAAPQVIIIRK